MGLLLYLKQQVSVLEVWAGDHHGWALPQLGCQDLHITEGKKHISHAMEKCALEQYVGSQGQHQTVYFHSLIRAFAVLFTNACRLQNILQKWLFLFVDFINVYMPANHSLICELFNGIYTFIKSTKRNFISYNSYMCMFMLKA